MYAIIQARGRQIKVSPGAVIEVDGTAGEQGKDIPPVIETYFGAPYIYGPQVVSILENTGGNPAVDARDPIGRGKINLVRGFS